MTDAASRIYLALAIVSLAGIVVADFFAGAEVRMTSFYLIPLLLLTWSAGSTWGYAFTLLTLLLMLGIDRITGGASSRQFYFYISEAGRFISFFVIVTLASKLRAAHMQEWKLARTDSLTGLMNRRAFHLAMEAELARRARDWKPFALLYIDCDNFKLVNDTLGHREGDHLLQRIAESLQNHVRKGDLVARLGGDEFAVFLLDGDRDSHGATGAKLRDTLTREGRIFHPDVGFSMGIVTFMHLPSTLEEAVNRADRLMYRVKQQGKKNQLQETA